MSIVNLHVSQDRVYIEVDSGVGVANPDVVPEAIRRGQFSKLFVMPHLHALVAFRGTLAFILWCQNNLHMAAIPRYDDIAEFVDGLPALLDQCPAQFLQQDGVSAPAAELYFAAYSPASDRCVCVQVGRQDGGASFVIRRLDECEDADDLLTWWAPSIPNLHAFDVEDFEGTAKAQHEHMLGEFPHLATGGHMLAGELTREGVRVFKPR